MAKVRDSRSFAEKYVRRSTAAVNDYKAGIDSVTEAPGAKAVRNADQYLAGVQQSFEKWKQNTGSVKLEDWKKPAMEQGAQRYAPGVTAAQSKVEKYAADLLPAQDAMLRQLDQMPRGDFNQNMQRAFAFAQMMKDWGEQRRKR